MRNLLIISDPILETTQITHLTSDLESCYYLKDQEQLITNSPFTNYNDQICQDSLNIPLLKTAGASWPRARHPSRACRPAACDGDCSNRCHHK